MRTAPDTSRRPPDNQTEGVRVMAYAELHCLSNFTFLRGASHAEELVARAKELDYAALAITDECSLAAPCVPTWRRRRWASS